MASTNETTASSEQRDLATVRQFCERYPAFTVGGLRWLLFNRYDNGLDAAVVRVGPRRVLIDVARFFEWVDQQNVSTGP